MATRQTASKSAKRPPSPTARRPAASSPRGLKPSPARRALAAVRVPLAALRVPLAGIAAGWRAATRWAGDDVALTTLIVSVLGFADSVYLTYQHFSAAKSFAGCSATGTISCEAVTTSAWSYLFGTHLLPVSVLGLAFFAFMVVVNSPWGWRAPWPAAHWARLGAVVVGIVMVLYLVWAELFRINKICLYCTGVHILTFILFALIVAKVTFSGVKALPDSR